VALASRCWAAALARDLAVQAAFPDGIVWLPIGREPNLPARQEELYLFLTGQRENFRDAIQGRSFLSVALEGKTCLVILDDVWDSSHAEAFPVVTGSATRYLITTRNAEVLQTLNAPAVLARRTQPGSGIESAGRLGRATRCESAIDSPCE
jgi:hypothetical protein